METRREPTLASMLSDPLIRTVMAADHVDPVKLEVMLRRIAETIRPRLLRRPSPAESGCGCWT
jgi:hypothetical protein